MGVRRERVVLELEDQLSTSMLRAAAATALLDKNLDSLDHDVVRTHKTTRTLANETDGLSRSTGRAEKDIDKYSGRLALLGQVLGALGPAAVPIAGVAVPAVAGLAAQLGFAAAGAGVTVLAFQGVGGALDALNKAALKPTAENLKAAKDAMAQISPEARQFVRQLRDMLPELHALRDLSAGGIMPGFSEGLKGVETALPRVEAVVSAISKEIGSIGADLGGAIANGQADALLNLLATEGPAALRAMSTAVGHTAHALANLWIAFTPLNHDVSAMLVQATREFDRWTAGLADTAGFQEFIDYLHTTGPQVADTLGAIGNALVQIVEAAAPIGGPVLHVIGALANAIAKIADSDIGTPIFGLIAAISALNLVTSAYSAISKASFGGPAGMQLKRYAGSLDLVTSAQQRASLSSAQLAAAERSRNLAMVRGVLAVGALGAVSTGLAGQLGLTNTASLALIGSFGGGPGIAAGGLVGLYLDAKDAASGFGQAVAESDRAISTTNLEQLKTALADLKKERDDLSHNTGIGDFFSSVATRALHPKSVLGFGPGINEQLDSQIKLNETTLATKTASDRAAAAQQFLDAGFRATAAGIDTATQSAKDFETALAGINAVLTKRSAFRDYEQALDDFAARATKRADLTAKINAARADLRDAKTPAQRRSARDDIKTLEAQLALYKNTLDTTTQAGRDTQAALDTIAKKAIETAKEIQNPVKRSAFLDAARKQFLDAAEAAGMGKKAAKELATQFGLLDTIKTKVTITVDANGAFHIIDRVQRRLDRLKSQHLLRAGIPSGIADLLNLPGGQDGDPTTPYADGGYTGAGSKYQRAGVVHRGEFVFSSEATRGNEAALAAIHDRLRGGTGSDANRDLLRAINAGSRPIGPSGRQSAASSPMIDAASLAAMRPLYGDVHLQPHDYNEFTRQMENDRRLASLDGIR